MGGYEVKMSMSRVMESIEHDAFSRVMNPPEDGFGGQQADIKTFPDGSMWVICPYCLKKQFKVLPDTVISKLPYKCRGSNCKEQYWINTKNN
jgi:hypothetical protein